ncbi:MAG: ATP-binding protein [Bacteroidetes bacterium]|nr:ATP-binding protein [Bacteroidota bacterium]
MKLKSMKLKNFRSYKSEVVIEFDDLTAFVGKNDIGKSTVLEALDIFFNDGKGVVKLDKEDVNKAAASEGDMETIIAVAFEQLPTQILIDSTNPTTLQDEYLLNSNNQLEIIKKYSSGGKEKVFVKANHPTNVSCSNLLNKKNTELQEIIKAYSIQCGNQAINATMRKSIWQHFSADLQLKEVEIDVTKGETKSIWEKLQDYLPLYTLFQSDRKNSDGDSEVQDPLKEAVKQILNDPALKPKFDEIASVVKEKLQDVATRTLAKIQEMNPEVASSLNPVIPSSDNLKWTDVFKSVSISGDDDIPINKRGSGVKRLILLNFFRAEAERRKAQHNIPSVIYAVEEPETSQHADHQRKLIKAFIDLSKLDNTQVILTTHSSALVKELQFQHLRLVKMNATNKTVEKVMPGSLPYPSLNEVNYLAFSEVTEEYHNELYGHIEMKGEIANFKAGQPTMPYLKLKRDGITTTSENISLTEYVRHQIHHPENTHNVRFTTVQLDTSVNTMRTFIQTLT